MLITEMFDLYSKNTSRVKNVDCSRLQHILT